MWRPVSPPPLQSQSQARQNTENPTGCVTLLHRTDAELLLLDFRFLNFVLFCRELQHLRHFFCKHPVLHLHPEAVFELRPALPLPSGPQRSQQDQPGRRHQHLKVSRTLLDAIAGRETSAKCCSRSPSPSLSTWECAHCTTVNEMRAVLCTTCDRPRLATPAIAGPEGSGPTSQNTGGPRTHKPPTHQNNRCHELDRGFLWCPNVLSSKKVKSTCTLQKHKVLPTSKCLSTLQNKTKLIYK